MGKKSQLGISLIPSTLARRNKLLARSQKPEFRRQKLLSAQVLRPSNIGGASASKIAPQSSNGWLPSWIVGALNFAPSKSSKSEKLGRKQMVIFGKRLISSSSTLNKCGCVVGLDSPSTCLGKKTISITGRAGSPSSSRRGIFQWQYSQEWF